MGGCSTTGDVSVSEPYRGTCSVIHLMHFYFFVREVILNEKTSTENIVCGNLEPFHSMCFREMNGVICFLCTVAARLTFYILLQMSLFVNVTSSFQSIMHRVERAKPNGEGVSTLWQ